MSILQTPPLRGPRERRERADCCAWRTGGLAEGRCFGGVLGRAGEGAGEALWRAVLMATWSTSRSADGTNRNEQGSCSRCGEHGQLCLAYCNSQRKWARFNRQDVLLRIRASCSHARTVPLDSSSITSLRTASIYRREECRMSATRLMEGHASLLFSANTWSADLHRQICESEFVWT